MVIIKLLVLVAFVDVTLGSAPPSPPPTPAAPNEIIQRPHVVHNGFIEKQEIEPSGLYHYSYEIHDPATGITNSQYEIRYRDVTLGIYKRIGSDGTRSTVNYTIDANNVYRGDLTVDSLGEHRSTLGHVDLASPLALATPPNGDVGEFTDFLFTDRERIDNYSPHAESAFKTHNIVEEFFSIKPTFEYNWAYEAETTGKGIRSHYETYSGNAGKGRITLVNTDGCVSTMDYKVDAKNFAVSTIRAFGKRDISHEYFKPKYDPILHQIDLGSSVCEI